MALQNTTHGAECKFLYIKPTSISAKSAPKKLYTIASASTYYPAALINKPEAIQTPGFYNHISIKSAMEKIGFLSDNWNGYGANKFNPDFTKRVTDIALSLAKNPKIFPTGRNSIQFEYEKANGDYLEFELYDSGVISYLMLEGDNEKQSEISASDINKILKSFYVV